MSQVLSANEIARVKARCRGAAAYFATGTAHAALF